MNKYIVRQPIKDSNKTIFGYEVLYQIQGDGLYNDYAVADALSSFLMQNNEKVFDDKMSFMTFTPTLLFKNAQRMFKTKNLVVQIEDNVVVHPMALTMIQRIRDENYKIAVNDFQFAPRYFSLMEHVDYIKVDMRHVSEVSLANIVKMCAGLAKQCIVTGVDSKESYEKAVALGFDYFQGNYVAANMATKVQKTEYLKSNFFNLMAAVNREEPDVEEIENIISMDAALSYSLLKIVNSAHFALRHRTASIRQALVTIGLGQLRQWIYLLSFKDISDEGTEEFLRLSFLRATFASRLVDANKSMKLNRNDAYMLGMFSTLENLIDASIEESLSEIPISDEIKDALISGEGKYGPLYKLILSYERGEWRLIGQFAELLDIDTEIITQLYFDCVEAVDKIWVGLTMTAQGVSDERPFGEGTAKAQAVSDINSASNDGDALQDASTTASSITEGIAERIIDINDESDFNEPAPDEASGSDNDIKSEIELKSEKEASSPGKTVGELEDEARESDEKLEDDMINGMISGGNKQPEPHKNAKRSAKTNRILNRINK